ncbi:hypothetical protein MLD38_040841 [Melastoma candidum]|nr:hypothetical protein MLD38_040841 [Melastoma candidum]
MWAREAKELQSYFAGFKECAVPPPKKRKQMVETPDVNSTNPVKKARIVWTKYLEDKFIQAVNEIGLSKATPKKIQESMNVSWLALGQISSHLQERS